MKATTERRGEQRQGWRRVVHKLTHSHWLMMGLCVLVVAAVWLLPLAGVAVGSGAIFLLLGACVAMHVAMMGAMQRDGHGRSAGEPSGDGGEEGSAAAPAHWSRGSRES